MKTTGAAPSHPDEAISHWDPKAEDLKHYPHFDAPLRLSEIRKIINDPARVAVNAFFPLIEYEKKWQPFRTPQSRAKPAPKVRRIRYASRKDSYIYAKYRRILSPLYEQKLLHSGISDIPIAYRKIKGANGKGKCNIDFAKDAFDFISSLDKCFVITLDISQFFESLDHNIIEQVWCDLLGTPVLPPDHAAIFKSLSAYRWVDRTEAYRRLGYFGQKIAKNGTVIEGFLRPYKQMPKQLCSPVDFRSKIAGGSAPTIIRKNKNSYGIPQGTPISDLIANMYMMDFDSSIGAVASRYGGKALRYSDDIMLIIPTDNLRRAKKIEAFIRRNIGKFGANLIIKESKSSIHRFQKNGADDLDCVHIQGSGKNGLEYLGFRFDGKKVYLRDSTVSNLKRKMTYSAKMRANSHKRRFSNRSNSELIQSFNFDALFQSFMRVEDFDSSMSVKKWTFWTYAHRASETFGAIGSPIMKQIRYLKPDGRRLVEVTLST